LQLHVARVGDNYVCLDPSVFNMLIVGILRLSAMIAGNVSVSDAEFAALGTIAISISTFDVFEHRCKLMGVSSVPMSARVLRFE